VRVYEVDHPATQRAKQVCLVRRLGVLPDHVKFVDVDFNSQRFDSRLTQANLSSALSTLWIWEGVTNYLAAAAVADTFDSIRQLTPRSRVVFTYVHNDVLNESSTFPGIVALRRTLAQAGEEWTFGFDTAELPSYLAAHGFQWREDLGSVEYRRRYLPPTPRLLRGYEFYRLAVADAA
jgi:methyltransferase (TIGR00027 family)